MPYTEHCCNIKIAINCKKQGKRKFAHKINTGQIILPKIIYHITKNYLTYYSNLALKTNQQIPKKNGRLSPIR
jgi:hypothetical protein